MPYRSARCLEIPVLLTAAAVSCLASASADAQEWPPPGARVHVPLVRTYPANPRPRLGVWTRNFDNRRLCAVMITRVDPRMPAARIRHVYQREDGKIVNGRLRSLAPGDIISELVETETGRRWTIRKTGDLTQAIQTLPSGAEFELHGYQCANRYHSFTAIGQLD